MNLHDLHEAVRDHVLRNTISPDAAQAEHQAQAVRRHQEQEAERISRLPEIVKESEPISQEPLLRSRLKPLPKVRVSEGGSFSRKTNQPPT